jgi:hypothetical protein
VTANISLDTTNGGAVPAGALINLYGTVDGDVADTRQLTLRCGQQTLSIGQAIGGTNRFSVVTVRADDLAITANLRAQTINLYTGTPASRAMVIGDAVGGSFSLSDAELAFLTGISTLLIGETGQQAGTVTLRTVTSPVATAALSVYANNGSGGSYWMTRDSYCPCYRGSGEPHACGRTAGITTANSSNGVAGTIHYRKPLR